MQLMLGKYLFSCRRIHVICIHQLKTPFFVSFLGFSLCFRSSIHIFCMCRPFLFTTISLEIYNIRCLCMVNQYQGKISQQIYLYRSFVGQYVETGNDVAIQRIAIEQTQNVVLHSSRIRQTERKHFGGNGNSIKFYIETTKAMNFFVPAKTNEPYIKRKIHVSPFLLTVDLYAHYSPSL